ncbi:MAG: thioredoxin family protein [Armatimonadetes bacterium]|nr:thioredoxin family protein [Armatimonadota bacterium]
MKKKEPWWIAIVLGAGVLFLLGRSVKSMVASWPSSATEERAGPAMDFHGFHNAISHGEKVKLEEHLTQGKTVVFDFSSSFCPPCREFAPRLEALDDKRDDLVVVTVDINRPDRQGVAVSVHVPAGSSSASGTADLTAGPGVQTV